MMQLARRTAPIRQVRYVDCGRGNAHRPAGAQHLQSARYRQAHRRRKGAVSIFGGAVGRHRHQHRALDDGGTRRPRGRRARSHFAPTLPKAAAGRRSAGSIWAAPRNCRRHSKPRPDAAERRARPLLNLPVATASAKVRFHGWSREYESATLNQKGN